EGAGAVSSGLEHSEGGFAPLPNLPPGRDCAGKAGARTASITSQERFPDRLLATARLRLVIAMSVERAPAWLVPVTAPQRIEDRLPARPANPQARQQLLHRGVVGHEQALAVERQGEVTVADVERDPDGLGTIARRDHQHRLGAALDGEVPVRLDGDDVAGPEHAAGRQR